MTGTPRFLCSLLLRCYPSSYRETCGKELETAMLVCVARERRRAGALGAVYAWLRLAVDSLSAGVAFRRDEVRQRRRTCRDERGLAETAGGTIRRLRQVVAQGSVRDCCFAMRTLRRAPGFVFVASLTLALGI